MLLICDSGSTKADWSLKDGNTFSDFQTAGLNPVHMNEETILKIISSEEKISTNSSAVEEVYFFGAGCGSTEGQTRMVAVLKKIFSQAKISVDNDLMAAAIGTAGKENGIIAILGTGSNCCYYDGATIYMKNFGLGYILGDEASGAWFGKKFLREFLYGRLPEQLAGLFNNDFSIDREQVIDLVYRKPNANLYLSSFMPFIIKHKSDPFLKEFLRFGIVQFFETNINAFPESKKTTIHFVGSVAAILESEIRETGKSKNLRIGKILKRPMDGLKDFYTNY